MLRLALAGLLSLALGAGPALAQSTPTTRPETTAATAGGGLPPPSPNLATTTQSPPAAAPRVGTDPALVLVATADGTRVPVFGTDLFSGAFASARPGARPDYAIQPGDQIAVRMFGAVNSDAIQTVDPNGRLFIQGIGPIQVSGVPAGQLQSRVSTALRSVYTDAVGVYVEVVAGGTLGVYVTGDVEHVGRYVGSPGDSILYFLDQAGGIDPQRGSFRDITIRRGGQVVARYDLYDFILRGQIAPFEFRDGDIVFVAPRGSLVAAIGDVRNAYAFEAPAGARTLTGRDLAALAIPTSGATGATVTQVQNGLRNSVFYTLPDLQAVTLPDNATVAFRAEVFAETISVTLRGAVPGRTAFAVPRGSRLSQLLAQVNLEGTDIVREYIHIERESVAVAQKAALDRALDNLERAALTQPTYGSETVNAKSAEIAAIQAYVAQARMVVPQGKVAVYVDGVFNDVQLESGDVVVLPSRSDVVLVAGEVLSPGAFVQTNALRARDYINRAGGFAPNATKSRVVLRRPDGTALVASPKDRPRAGDQVVVTPNFGRGRSIQLLRDLTQIAFQIATTAAVAINLSNNN